MGYTTDFVGKFELDKPLTVNHKNFLTKFSETRRMKRDPKKIETLKNGGAVPFTHELVGLPVGDEGQNFVDGTGFSGQDQDSSIVEYNATPSGQPSLWCQWVPNEDGTAIEWDGGEKFYNYVEWLEYLINNYLKPWGYNVNGEVEWIGEESDDRGKIVVKNNKVKTKIGRIVYK